LVSPSGHDVGNCTSSPCRTIGYAVSRASSGDTIVVAGGVYHESVTITKRLALVSARGRDGAAAVDAAGFDRGIVIRGADAAGSSITGFTIRNAGLEGIWAIQTSRLTIADNKLTKNDAYGPFAPQCVTEPDDCGEALHLETVTFSTVRDNLVRDNVGGILLTDEEGPVAYNRILNNTVLDNAEDCGITLPSHFFQLTGPVSADKGGVYANLVQGNDVERNGAAGIGVFAGPPGAAAWGNVIVDNLAKDNGLPGVAIHSHTPGQLVKDNVVFGNTLVNNGPDDDALSPPSGIVIFADKAAGAAPIQRTVVVGNRIRHDAVGIYIANAVNTVIFGNTFTDVAVPILRAP
jgi:nitrous oxidase accessory protein NosD